MTTRSIVASAGIAVGTLALLGLLTGWVGASRAYAVGVHTLFLDHPAAVGIMVVVAIVTGLFVGRGLATDRDLVSAVGAVIVADVLVALLITLTVEEMARHPDIPRAVLAETAGGLQIAAIAAGLTIGRWLGRRRAAPRRPV